MNDAEREQDKLELLSSWKKGIRICHKCHVRSAAIMQRRNRALGIPVVILTSVAGTTIFATLEGSPEPWVRILIGLLSVIAAVLAGLQTFLGYGELAERHKTVSQKYGALRREIEEMLAIHHVAREVPDEFLASVRTRWDQVDDESPSLSQKLYDRIAAQISGSRRTGGPVAA